jgi:hypothetical protein
VCMIIYRKYEESVGLAAGALTVSEVRQERSEHPETYSDPNISYAGIHLWMRAHLSSTDCAVNLSDCVGGACSVRGEEGEKERQLVAPST